jgi:nitrogen-specific signal transduction histidine kinase
VLGENVRLVEPGVDGAMQYLIRTLRAESASRATVLPEKVRQLREMVDRLPVATLERAAV